jgi:cell division protein FtsL
MTGDAFEYAIKKDVRNNPIVREVDEERHREMWRSSLIGVFLVLVLLFSAWQHFEQLRHGYEFEQAQSDHEDAAGDNRRLRADLEELTAPSRIQEIATERLGMREPAPGDATVIERLAPTPVPSRSVVARR